jgi:hypothetical protein
LIAVPHKEEPLQLNSSRLKRENPSTAVVFIESNGAARPVIAMEMKMRIWRECILKLNSKVVIALLK